MLYHKIQTVFKRDPETKHKTLLMGEYSLPEFEYLKDNTWIFTEKVDGTNIRIIWDGDIDNTLVKFGGRTERAQIPTHLLNELIELFPAEKFRSAELPPLTLFGEGYGPKIQKGGNYRKTPGFVLFDVKIGDVWLTRESVVDISNKLRINVVPIIGTGTLDDLVELCRNGFTSTWGDFPAEGVVARPKIEFLDRQGKRVITKLKLKDFR